MVFEYVLKLHGLDPKTDLNMDQSIDFGATAAAFLGGKGDYTIEFEPHATVLEEDREGYVLASLGEESGYVPYTAFCARKSYLEENPEEIASFLRALKKAMDFMTAHTPEEIAAVIQPQFAELETATLTTIVERYQKQDSWKQDLVFSSEAFELLQAILLDSGVITKKAPYEELVDTSFVKSIQ